MSERNTASAPGNLPSVPNMRQRRPWWRFGCVTGAAGIVALALAGITLALAASGMFNLGKPTNTVSPNPYFPLSGFHHVRQTLKPGLRAEVLVIGESAFAAGAESWPVVKALQQFGTFTGLKPLDRPTYTVKIGDKTYSLQTPSSVDWVKSHYRSRYVSFVHRDLQRYDSDSETFVPFQKLSADERALYQKDAQQSPNGQASLPLIAVGDYEQVATQIIVDGDFRAPPDANNQSGPFLPFATIQSALETGHDPPDTRLVEGVNAEANVLIALICHADGLQPSKVCGRAVIKKVLKSVH